MTGSEANRQRVLRLVKSEREQILEQYGYIGIRSTASTAVRRGRPPMSETRQLSFYDSELPLRLVRVSESTGVRD